MAANSAGGLQTAPMHINWKPPLGAKRGGWPYPLPLVSFTTEMSGASSFFMPWTW